MKDDDYHPEEHEENLYSEDQREEFVDGGEISAEEDAFMKGYDEADEADDEDEDSEDEDSENKDEGDENKEE